jgi:hypothetical protein
MSKQKATAYDVITKFRDNDGNVHNVLTDIKPIELKKEGLCHTCDIFDSILGKIRTVISPINGTLYKRVRKIQMIC